MSFSLGGDETKAEGFWEAFHEPMTRIAVRVGVDDTSGGWDGKLMVKASPRAFAAFMAEAEPLAAGVAAGLGLGAVRVSSRSGDVNRHLPRALKERVWEVDDWPLSPLEMLR